jgi:RNA polymerase sigma factor (sigma-70 family)
MQRRLGALALPMQPDTRLVELTRLGHDAAFEEIVRRHRAALVGFAAGFVPFHRAEDVVQAALARAHRAIVDGDAEIALKAWLFTIVRNAALNDLRDERIHDQLDDSLDGVVQPPEVAERRESIRALVAALVALPSAQREAIVQRELEGRGHEEIARALGTSGASVRGLIFRAREALRGAVGVAVPLPLLRLLLAAPIGGAGAGGAVTAAGGSAVGKAATAATIAAVAVGAGIAVERGREGDRAADPGAAPGRASPDSREATVQLAATGGGAAGSAGAASRGPGGDAPQGAGGEGGPARGGDGTGTGGGTDRAEPGPPGSGESGPGDDSDPDPEDSGPGSKDDDVDEPEEDEEDDDGESGNSGSGSDDAEESEPEEDDEDGGDSSGHGGDTEEEPEDG